MIKIAWDFLCILIGLIIFVVLASVGGVILGFLVAPFLILKFIL